jgi:Arylsulfatase A and related enzymes
MRLLEALDGMGALEDTVVVLTADHGESLGERGVWFHDSALTDEQLRVPLAVAGPGVPAGVRQPAPVSLLGLAPTLCALLGVRAPAGAVGGGWARRVLATGPVPEASVPPVFAEVFAADGVARGVVQWPHKLIVHVRAHYFELYDLARDPAERVNLYDLLPQRARALERLLGAWTSAVLSVR